MSRHRSAAGQALDNSIVFGNTYEYRAQRIVRVADGDNADRA